MADVDVYVVVVYGNIHINAIPLKAAPEARVIREKNVNRPVRTRRVVKMCHGKRSFENGLKIAGMMRL